MKNTPKKLQKNAEPTNNALHYVYIVKCADNTLYTGWTTDLPKRIENHNKGLGAKYTRSRLPVKLVYKEEFTTKNAALSREFYIKNKLTREDKLKLIKGSEGF